MKKRFMATEKYSKGAEESLVQRSQAAYQKE